MEKQPTNEPAQPWQDITLTERGKWFAFKGKTDVPDNKYVAAQNPTNGHIVVNSAEGVTILDADQQVSLGHSTMKEIEKFVETAKSRKK